MINTEPVLVHLHPDFQEPLEELFDAWNGAQQTWNFVALRPRRGPERTLLTPGAISDAEASLVAAEMRASAGYASSLGILVFTEKRLYDDCYYQLFVGGREANEHPPRIGVLALDFMRKAYTEYDGAPVLFRAIGSNILFSLGIDCGLNEHDHETRGCVMDFCAYMPDIEMGLRNGPRFCHDCADALDKRGQTDLVRLAEIVRKQPGLSSIEEAVSESIVLRGKRYATLTHKFDYDVALSFAGADRLHAEVLAVALRAAGFDVFYDQFDQAGLWGKNLHSYLSELYRLRARYCVVFLSENYTRSRWTKLELDCALAREFEEGKEYVLPIRLDKCGVAGILPTRSYLEWNDHSVDDIVRMLGEKLVAHVSNIPVEPEADP